MMKNQLVIRLQRCGRIKRPFFLLIVTKKNKSESGAYIARVGYYDPFLNKKKANFSGLVIYKDILNYWIARGAIPNNAVQKLLY
jgi:small subunit ribosomal protein S16